MFQESIIGFHPIYQLHKINTRNPKPEFIDSCAQTFVFNISDYVSRTFPVGRFLRLQYHRLVDKVMLKERIVLGTICDVDENSRERLKNKERFIEKFSRCW